jgi:tetratricopeptide (TPR) repeat protein
MRKTVPVFFVFVLVASMASMSCHERITVYPPPRVPNSASSQTAKTVPVNTVASVLHSTIKPVPIPSERPYLNLADKNFREGNYLQAIEDYWAHIDNNPQTEARERVLFNIGLSYALAPRAERNLPGARDTLQRLLHRFPDSEYRSSVKLIMDLIAQVEQLEQQSRDNSARQNSKIEQLQEELDKLKAIDLQRRPSRPSE